MNIINSQYIDSAIEEAEASYSGVLDLYKNTSLDTDPQNFGFVSSYPSFSSMKEFKGNTNFISNIADKTGIYIHFPFCERVCNYCSYIKTGADDAELIQKYIETLKKEIRFYAKQTRHSTVKYIYFGGGTPTAINIAFLKDIVDELYAQFTISNDVEFTCEGCPNTLDGKMISFLSELGVNRISVGIQSFDENVLLEMKREQTIPKINMVIENLHKFFPNHFNIDLIFGHYASDKSKLYNDLEKVRQYKIPSVSFYQIWLCHATPAKLKSNHITFEELLYQRMIIAAYMDKLNYTNRISDLYTANTDSNFYFQAHKWKNNDLIGIGTNSHGYINGVLYRNFCSIGDDSLSITGYMNMVEKNGHGISSLYNLNDTEKDKRRICLGLKLNENLEYRNTVFQYEIEQLTNVRLIIKDGNYIKLSKTGFLMSDIIVKHLSYK